MLAVTENTGVCTDMPCCQLTPVFPSEHLPHCTQITLVSTLSDLDVVSGSHHGSPQSRQFLEQCVCYGLWIVEQLW